jgi:uncharacterized membrane protein
MLAVRAVAFVTTLLALAACGPPAVPPAQQYATITGTVVDAVSNAPISGATVAVNVVLTTTTSSNGSFTISNIPNGPLECVASAANYAPNSSWCAAPLSPGQKLNVTVQLTHT